MISQNASMRTILKTEDPKSRGEFFNAMDAISRGVETQHEWFADFQLMVIERSIDVARKLSIPEKEIRGWASARVRSISERNKTIESVLKRIE